VRGRYRLLGSARARGGVPLPAADPLIQLGRRSLSGKEGAGIAGRKHGVHEWGGWLPGSLVGGGADPLRMTSGLRAGHTQAVADEGLAQRLPGRAELRRAALMLTSRPAS
jgi:hypothetical protein